MTEEEIKAKKFAMESQKDNAAADAKEEARKKAEKEGKKFDEKAFDKQKKEETKFADAPTTPRSPATNQSRTWQQKTQEATAPASQLTERQRPTA